MEMKIVIFGTGLFYHNRKTKECIKNSEIVAFLDNDKTKIGGLIDGKIVYSPEDIYEIEFNYIVLMSKAVEEMRLQLVMLGIEQDKIIDYSDFVIKYFSLKRSNYNKSNVDNFFSNNHPKVSVIIPNYNYEQYLEERIKSIINQTYLPEEIIFLDDRSTDNSVEYAKRILGKCNIPYKIIVNSENSGCFKQWIKGISLCKGDFIWIAEADDLCENNFLERLLPQFFDEEVNLSYCQSEVIWEDGTHSGYVYTEYTKSLSETKWETDYINSGASEVIEALLVANTIPNASGTIIRKSALEGIEKMLSQFYVAGDWFTYLYAIRYGKIAFTSHVLNYHRRHSQSIIARSEKQMVLFEELFKIKIFIAENFVIPASMAEKFLMHVAKEYRRLIKTESSEKFGGESGLNGLQNDLENIVFKNLNHFTFACNIPRKKILFVAPDFSMGGGQTLVIRLSNFLSRYHDVYIYNARPWIEEERVTSMITNKVKILDSNGTEEQLKEYIIKLNIETINTHIWWSDKIVYKALQAIPGNRVNHLLCMHGCYEMLIDNPECDREFRELAPLILKRADNIIYASNKNRKIFNYVDIPDEKLHQIYYGYEIQSIPKRCLNDMEVSKKTFTIGLVARGIKEKGFEEAIEVIKRIRKRISKDIQLILIGNGEFINYIKKKYAGETYIHFKDNLQKPSEWIGWVKTFDLGILPTYYISETLPNSIIEYLAYGVPVVATNIGDIPEMLTYNGQSAGLIVKLKGDVVDKEELELAIEKMCIDKDFYETCKRTTSIVFKKFEMNNFVESYFKMM